jgi:hypothetical protein
VSVSIHIRAVPGSRTPRAVARGILARIGLRLLAMPAAIWQNTKPAHQQAITDRL